jgi:ATP-dependent NAD(P)H-hydrate dehydratase
MQHRELGDKERVDVKDKVMGEVSKWLERFDCIVIGPGLGRDSLLLVRSSFPLL